MSEPSREFRVWLRVGEPVVETTLLHDRSAREMLADMRRYWTPADAETSSRGVSVGCYGIDLHVRDWSTRVIKATRQPAYRSDVCAVVWKIPELTGPDNIITVFIRADGITSVQWSTDDVRIDEAMDQYIREQSEAMLSQHKTFLEQQRAWLDDADSVRMLLDGLTVEQAIDLLQRHGY